MNINDTFSHKDIDLFRNILEGAEIEYEESEEVESRENSQIVHLITVKEIFFEFDNESGNLISIG